MMARDADRALDALYAIPPDLPREDWHEAGRAAIAAGLTVDDLLDWSRPASNFKSESDVRAAFRTIRPDGKTGPGTLFYIAQRHGWTPPKNGAHRPHAGPKASSHSREKKSSQAPDLAALWASWAEADEMHPYIFAKNGTPDGLRVIPADSTMAIAGHRVAGWLAVPARSLDGTLRTVQLIPPEAGAGKLSWPGARFEDAMFIVGSPDESDRIFIFEGIGQAWACWRATGHAAAVTFGAGRMAVVAEALRKEHPDKRLILCPDRGKESQAAAVARKVGGEWVELPADKPSNYDACDFATEHDDEALAELLGTTKRPAPEPRAWELPPSITLAEWEHARASPPCIVERYLFADVKINVAPGGMSKTTLKLHEAVHIVLGLALYGRTVEKSGPVMILTAEDPRAILVARLREIAEALNLTAEQRQIVRDQVLISDLSGLGFKLTEVSADVVVPSTKVDALITGLVNVKPVLVVIDPAVSFGVGEARVNDAEQGLIEAARRIRNALGCAVEYVHHSGKANARDRATDQYSGRGGSALADGARMVSVLAPVTADEWLAETGQELAEDENAIRLALPKLSYCPKQPDILIRRRGYLFEHVEPSTNGKQAAVAANADMIHRLLVSELQAGRRHSKNTLEHQVELKRTDLRAALDWLEACGRLEWRANPSGGQGGRRHYLHPVASPNGNGEANAKGAV